MSQQASPPPYVGQHPGAGPAPKKGMPVWLIVLVAVLGFFVLIGGVLGVLAYQGFTKFIKAAKMAEAKEGIGRIAKDASASYEREQLDASDGSYHVLCASASSPVPASAAEIRGKKYMSSAAEWDADKSIDAGFACLRFAMMDPQYYQYDYKTTSAGTTPDQFRAIAHGDLDGDGDLSTFVLEGRVAPGDMLMIAPSFIETDGDE